MEEHSSNRDLEDIIIYHGSLAELNSRNPDKQYQFAEELFFISEAQPEYSDYLTKSYKEIIKEELVRKKYNGLVNARTMAIAGIRLDKYRIEGTPILKCP